MYMLILVGLEPKSDTACKLAPKPLAAKSARAEKIGSCMMKQMFWQLTRFLKIVESRAGCSEHALKRALNDHIYTFHLCCKYLKMIKRL